MWAAYVRALERRPLRVKVASAAAIFSSGDVATQTLVEGTALDSLDVKRTARMASFGCVVTAWVHCWWGTLEPMAASIRCPAKHRLQNTVLKVACDQTFGAGAFNTIFFSWTAFTEGLGYDGAEKRVREQLWPQMQRHWTFWPWFHLVNFYYNGLHQRVFFQNVALVGWSALLSSVGAAATAAASRDCLPPTQEAGACGCKED